MAGRIAYYGNIVKDGLVFLLDAAKKDSYPGSGTLWNDITENNFDGTLINGPIFNTSNGGNILFDGVNDFVNFTTTPQIEGTQLSFSVWNYGLVAKQSTLIFLSSSGIRCLNIHLPWSDSTVYFDSGNTLFYDRISKFAQPNEYQGWHYWVFTKNSTTQTMSIYLDGNLWHSQGGKPQPIALPIGNKNLCCENGTTHFHNGYLGYLSLYNRELSPTEILQNYNATKNRYI
jgi:hypothetical protein